MCRLPYAAYLRPERYEYYAMYANICSYTGFHLRASSHTLELAYLERLAEFLMSLECQTVRVSWVTQYMDTLQGDQDITIAESCYMVII